MNGLSNLNPDKLCHCSVGEVWRIRLWWEWRER